MPSQEPQVQELIRTLNSLAGELEVGILFNGARSEVRSLQVLVDRTRSSGVPDPGQERKMEPSLHTEKDFSKHKALNSPVR